MTKSHSTQIVKAKNGIGTIDNHWGICISLIVIQSFPSLLFLQTVRAEWFLKKTLATIGESTVLMFILPGGRPARHSFLGWRPTRPSLID